MITIFI